MHQELVILTVTFPCLVSWLFVSCLKAVWKAPPPELDNEVYKRTVVPAVPKEHKKLPKSVKKDKKEKKTSKFFVFRGKDEDLKSPISSDLSLKPTQSSFCSEETDDEHTSPFSPDSHMFSDSEQEPEKEHLGSVILLPTPPSDYARNLRDKVRKERHRKKSPREYFYPEDEDTLFSVPSLARDPLTMQSTSSMVPLDIQDSRILHVKNERLGGWKKSHAVYSADSVNDPVYDNI